MTDRDDHDSRMPPDPWADEGIDLWVLERAEEMTAHDVDPASSRWDDLSGPSIEEFDEAAREFEHLDEENGGSGPLGMMRPWVGVIAAIVVFAFILTYAIR